MHIVDNVPGGGQPSQLPRDEITQARHRRGSAEARRLVPVIAAAAANSAANSAADIDVAANSTTAGDRLTRDGAAGYVTR